MRALAATNQQVLSLLGRQDPSADLERLVTQQQLGNERLLAFQRTPPMDPPRVPGSGPGASLGWTTAVIRAFQCVTSLSESRHDTIRRMAARMDSSLQREWWSGQVDSDTSLHVLIRARVRRRSLVFGSGSAYGCDGVKQGRAEKSAAFLTRVRQIYARHQARQELLGRYKTRYTGAESGLFLAGLRPELRKASARWVRTRQDGLGEGSFSANDLLAELECHEDTLLLQEKNMRNTHCALRYVGTFLFCKCFIKI